MRLITALRTGAVLAAVAGLLAAAGEVVWLATDLIPAYQRGGALALAPYALPLYAMIGLGTGANLGGALWLAGVPSGTPGGERTLVAELRRSEMWSGVSHRFDRDLLAPRQGSWKSIASSVGNAELYNLAEDPAELDNRPRAEPERVSQFQREALRWMTGHARRGPRRAIDRAIREQLKALGY